MVEFAGNGRKWLKITVVAENSWKQLEITGITGNGLTWLKVAAKLDMAESGWNDWKFLEIAGNDWNDGKQREIAGMTGMTSSYCCQWSIIVII